MSGDARITGQITIDPPITWPELADKQWATTGDYQPEPPYWADVRLGVGIVPIDNETSAYTLVASVQRIVDEFGTTPDGTARTFTGHLHVVWGGGEAVYRVVVRDGRAVEVQPTVVWPADAQDGAP